MSLAWVIAGNPISQLAWIVERFHDWADQSVRPSKDVFTDKDLLVNAALFTHADAFDTSARYYAQSAGPRWMPQIWDMNTPYQRSGSTSGSTI